MEVKDLIHENTVASIKTVIWLRDHGRSEAAASRAAGTLSASCTAHASRASTRPHLTASKFKREVPYADAGLTVTSIRATQTLTDAKYSIPNSVGYRPGNRRIGRVTLTAFGSMPHANFSLRSGKRRTLAHPRPLSSAHLGEGARIADLLNAIAKRHAPDNDGASGSA